MQGPGLPAGCFRHSLCRPAGGSSQFHRKALLPQKFNDAVDGGGFSGTGPAGYDHHSVLHRLDNRFLLPAGQADIVLFFKTADLFLHAPNRVGDLLRGQIPKHFGRSGFRLKESGKVNGSMVLPFFHYNPLGQGQGCQGIVYKSLLHGQKPTGFFHHLRLWKIGMPVGSGPGQDIFCPGRNTVGRMHIDPHAHSNPVRCLKADPRHILRQTIGILLHQIHGSGAVCLVDLHGIGRGNPIGLQKNHHFTDFLLLRKRRSNHFRPGAANALHLFQSSGIELNDIQYIQPESLHQLPGGGRPDSLDQSGSQVIFHAHKIGRRHTAVGFHLQLPSVLRMSRPFPLQPDPFPRIDKGKISNCSDFQIGALFPQLHDGKTVVFIAEDNIFYNTDYLFHSFHLDLPLGKPDSP